MWNFLIQCLSGIDYFHKQNLDFVGIKLNNVYMNNEENLKIDIISWPPKFSDRNYDKKNDILFLGRIFYALSFYKKERIKISNNISDFPIVIENNFEYPILMNIIYLMLNFDVKKIPNSSTLLHRVENEYKAKYPKKVDEESKKNSEDITSIESVLRCLYAYPDLNEYYIKNKNNKGKFEKDNDKYYINNLVMIAFNKFSEKGESYLSEVYNKIKRAIICENSKLDLNYDIDPVYVTAFLLGKMHLEENELKNKQYIFDSILNGEEEDKTNELQMRNNFIRYYDNNINSHISNLFFGYEEIKKTFADSKISTFSFNDFCFITFDVSSFDKEDTFDLNGKLNNEEEENNENQNKEELKTYYISQNLIIYFNRGKDFDGCCDIGNYTKLNILNSASSKEFDLVGCIFKSKNTKIQNFQKYHFFYLFKDSQNQWICPKEYQSYINESKETIEVSIDKFQERENPIIMLFYEELK